MGSFSHSMAMLLMCDPAKESDHFNQSAKSLTIKFMMTKTALPFSKYHAAWPRSMHWSNNSRLVIFRKAGRNGQY